MGMTSSFLNGAAFVAGFGAGLFGATETVLEGGHYIATGLRKTADGVDYVTDKAQEGCRTGKANCELRETELSKRAKEEAKNAEGGKETFASIFEELNSELGDLGQNFREHRACTQAKIDDIEDAEIVPEKPQRPKTGIDNGTAPAVVI